MKRIRKYLITGLLLVHGMVLPAQKTGSVYETCSDKLYYSFENLEWHNPWLYTGNAAGMILCVRPFEKVNAFTNLALNAGYREGDMRNVYDAESEYNLGLDVKSYMKIGKVYLYGKFVYDYGMQRNIQWHGLLDPYRTPFMMADSIKGDYALEQYKLSAGLSVPLSAHFSAGAYVDYDVAAGAKHKDLRNKNTYMDFALRPAVMYHQKGMKIGLNGLYQRTTEAVDYRQVDASTNKTLFTFYGMWFNTSSLFSTTASSQRQRNLQDEVWGGSLQAEFTLGAIRFLNEFSASFLKQSQDDGGATKRQFGDTESTRYAYRGILQHLQNHRLMIDLSFGELMGYKPIQREELNTDTRVREWVIYGYSHSYTRNWLNGDVNYTYKQNRSSWNDSWFLTAGVRGYQVSNEYIEYPQLNKQEWKYWEAYIRFGKNWLLSRSMLDITPELAYGQGNGFANEQTEAEPADILPPEQTRQLLLPLNHEFAFMTADKLSAGIGAKYTWFLNPAKGTNIYINARYGYVRALSELLDGKNANRVGLSLGITF